MLNDACKIYTDGGSRGNPGPSACAFVVKDSNQQTVYQQGKFLGVGTNNQAEYSAVLLALEYLAALSPKPAQLNFYLDSELVVKQLSGLYRIKDLKLQKLAKSVQSYLSLFAVTYTHIPRSLNTAADLLVNQILDQHLH